MSCGSLHNKNAVSPESLYTSGYWDGEGRSSFYDQVYNLDVLEVNGKTKNRFILDVLPDNPYGIVMEVGCAPGSLMNAILRENKAGHVIGVDVDSSLEEKIRGVAQYPIQLIFGMFPNCTKHLESTSTDSIICCDVLEHIEDGPSFLQECARLLAFRGTLVLMLPLLNQDGELQCERMACDEHPWIYHPSYIKEMLLDAGFYPSSESQWALGHDVVVAIKQ